MICPSGFTIPDRLEAQFATRLKNDWVFPKVFEALGIDAARIAKGERSAVFSAVASQLTHVAVATQRENLHLFSARTGLVRVAGWVCSDFKGVTHFCPQSAKDAEKCKGVISGMKAYLDVSTWTIARRQPPTDGCLPDSFADRTRVLSGCYGLSICFPDLPDDRDIGGWMKDLAIVFKREWVTEVGRGPGRAKRVEPLAELICQEIGSEAGKMSAKEVIQRIEPIAHFRVTETTTRQALKIVAERFDAEKM